MHPLLSHLKNKITPIALCMSVCCATLYCAGSIAQDGYWRWTDEEGLIHYGSAPPPGVTAERVTNYGINNAEFTEKSDDKKAVPQYTAAQLAIRKQRCDDETKRLAHFEKSRVIRMKMPDGTTKTMSQEEITREKEISHEIMAKFCDTHPPVAQQ